MPMNAEQFKRAAAAKALELVRPGMRLGLGTGSTAKHFVELLGERVRGGLDVVGVPTSEATHADAQRAGIPLATLDELPELDLTVDGADEIAHQYATHFTEAELKEILAFYQSPAGKKMLLEQPKVVNGSMQFAQDWANKLSTEVTAKMRDELKKRGHPM
jgi:hypothetical protein